MIQGIRPGARRLGRGGVAAGFLAAQLALCGASALAAAPARAQNTGLGGHDSKAPINISADALEVFQEEKRAVFTGQVEAAQGDMRLKAASLEVHYDGAADGAVTGKIRRIDARGDVLVTSPKETARGDWGVYDVAKGEIRLGGAVVLTRDRNVLRGESLTIDLDSGRSRLQGAKGQRVQGVFTPAGQ